MTPRRAVRLLQLVRARAAFVGRGVELGRRPRATGLLPHVRNLGEMRLGSHLVVSGRQFRSALTTGPEGSLVIGDELLLNQGATVHADLSVTIGDHVYLADLCAVYDTDFHDVEPGTAVRRAPVTIGDNAWIGRGALVLPGVSVGAHAVVAAGAVVTSDVPPATLVAGVRARPVRSLRHEPGYRRQ